MKTLSRWNTETRAYELYGVPQRWNVSVHEQDMGTRINCASCGRSTTFGEAYSSLQIHTLPSGFGYAVCDICHEAEVKRELRAIETTDERSE